MSGAPYFSQMSLRCGKCETRWMEWQPNNCRFQVWIAAIDALRCQKCGAGPEAIFALGGVEGEIEAAKETP